MDETRLRYSGPGVVPQTESGVVYLVGALARSRQQEPVNVCQTAIECTGRALTGKSRNGIGAIPCALVDASKVKHELADCDFPCVVAVTEQ